MSAKPSHPQPPGAATDVVVLRLGAEGGSVEIRMSVGEAGSRFVTERVDQSGWLLEPEETEIVLTERFESLAAALASLDGMRWWLFYPLVVAPAFADAIAAAVRARTGRARRDYERWAERACEASPR